mgnify:CR=1 FL=1
MTTTSEPTRDRPDRDRAGRSVILNSTATREISGVGNVINNGILQTSNLGGAQPAEIATHYLARQRGHTTLAGGLRLFPLEEQPQRYAFGFHMQAWICQEWET